MEHNNIIVNRIQPLYNFSFFIIRRISTRGYYDANCFIDKNLLLVDGSIRNALLCVKNILAQDVGCGTSDCAEGTFRHSSFKEKFSPFSRVTCRTGISPGIQTDLAVTSCFQMRHDVRIECNRRMNIQDRRNSRLVDVEYVRRNRRFWIRIM